MQPALHHVSPYSGSWYPDDASELRELLDRLFADSENRTGRWSAPQAAGFVVPHAGLVYSGTVAAAAYRQIRALAPERIVLLGFRHRGMSSGAWLPDVAAFQTPLGDIGVDREFCAALAATGAFKTVAEQTLCDHSIEIQLPLLQAAAPSARIVPIYVSQLDTERRSATARKLAPLIEPGTILVASSDFTHYGRDFAYQPFPADDSTGERLRELDESVIDAASTLDPAAFLRRLHASGSTVCGYEPIALLLETLRLLGEREEIFQDTLDYRTSGDITGDFHLSVSYAALGYFPYRAFELGPEDQQVLIESARRTLAHFLETGKREPVAAVGGTAALERRAGVFVTLHSQGELRGCVGRAVSDQPLARTTASLTLAAALDDTRFPRVRPGEEGI